ncbi:MAG: Transposase like protein [Gemmataceae bacterium]|nr:Transposase like protein [Gemmataceae bacterium]
MPVARGETPGGAGDPPAGMRISLARCPMPQSFTCLHYHLVFSTRHREPTITPDLRPRLWEYLGGIVRGEGGISLAVGGTADHVHLLATLRQQPALADFVRQLKAGSSGWVHDTFPAAGGFWWQTGYGAFTVSHSVIDTVKAYIANQDEHHRTRTFQDEFRALLTRHGLGFDENYLWD